MDPTFTALIAMVIAFPVLAIIGFVMALGNRERLKRLEFRLAGLERRLADLPGGVPSLAPVPSAVPEALTPAKAPETKAEEAAPAPAAPETPVTPPIPPPAPAAPSKPRVSLEERFGTQWVVWAGGIALALGGFFLVRQAIEQGWFGPGARVLLGAIVALVLIGAGEWTRRREIVTGLAGLPKAHIPSVLTAAGTAIAYADVYAAYALYHFIGPGAAFLLLGLVALGTLAAALLHGPALAGLGLIGAFVTPLIVSTETPNYLALYLYLAVVTAAAFALARVAALALARHRRGRSERAVDSAGDRRVGLAARARLPCGDRLRLERSPHRLGLPVRAPVGARRDRRRLIRRARRLSLRRDAARARDRA